MNIREFFKPKAKNEPIIIEKKKHLLDTLINDYNNGYEYHLNNLFKIEKHLEQLQKFKDFLNKYVIFKKKEKIIDYIISSKKKTKLKDKKKSKKQKHKLKKHSLQIIKNFINKYVLNKYVWNKIIKPIKAIKNFINRYVFNIYIIEKRKFKAIKTIHKYLIKFLKWKKRYREVFNIRFKNGVFNDEYDEYNEYLQQPEKIYIIKILNDLLNSSETIYNLYKKYDFILILKKINKTYTEEKYLNIKFMNFNGLNSSPAYHLYIKNDIIFRITYIQSIQF